ncbi:MAG: metallophosphoesterase [Deltaproteobacteria bacterium]|nr:metallophosphoesterase [Deltaproteobacteria bacterium]
MRRHLVLPARGTLLVSTDVHGNAEDIARLADVFLEERSREPETHWVVLGDIVHAPSAEARTDRPELYDFDDGTMAIVDRLLELQKAHAGHVHFVLGNHDHGHVGGPHTHKFHDDEVNALENALSPAERTRLRELLEPALLAIAAPCGVLMTHGAPDATLEDLRALDDVPLDVAAMTSAQRATMRALLTAYGQTDPVASTMLANVSRGLGFELRVVVHGHDRDERGFFHEGVHQVCPCIFGAPRAQKRFVRLDLGARYENGQALRDGVEIVRLHA